MTIQCLSTLHQPQVARHAKSCNQEPRISKHEAIFSEVLGDTILQTDLCNSISATASHQRVIQTCNKEKGQYLKKKKTSENPILSEQLRGVFIPQSQQLGSLPARLTCTVNAWTHPPSSLGGNPVIDWLVKPKASNQ